MFSFSVQGQQWWEEWWVVGWMRLYEIGRPQVTRRQLSCKCKSSWEISSFCWVFTFSAPLRGCLKEDSHQITQRFTAGNVPQMGFRIPRDLQMHQIVDSPALSLSLSCPHSLFAWIQDWGEHTQINGLLLIRSHLQKVAPLKHNVRRLINLFPLPHRKQLKTKCMLGLSQCYFGNRSDRWHAVIPHINLLAQNKGWEMWGEQQIGREWRKGRKRAKFLLQNFANGNFCCKLFSAYHIHCTIWERDSITLCFKYLSPPLCLFI